MDIGEMRRDFESAGLTESDLERDPYQQFQQWFHAAESAGIEDVNACSLATAGASATPTIRTVLLKYYDEHGFVFYTNYDSRKAHDLRDNPQAAMLFPWLPLNRQIVIEGSVERVSKTESLRYFSSRPRGSQLGAWVSRQSAVIESRGALEQKLEQIKRRFLDGEVPLPDFWGGYRVVPRRIEFWQGRPSRLHDRFEYQWSTDHWQINRLQP